MEPMRPVHSRTMTHRTLIGLAVAASLVACLGKTTSLGGPSGNLSSASSSEDGSADSEAGQGSDEFDAGLVTHPDGIYDICHGYSWDPVPTSTPCEYLLPSGAPPQNDDPRLDPSSTSWRTHSASIDVIIPNNWRQGLYVGSSEGCAGGDGWYYADDADADAQTHTRFVICPASCASIANDGALLRLSVVTWCEE